MNVTFNKFYDFVIQAFSGKVVFLMKHKVYLPYTFSSSLKSCCNCFLLQFASKVVETAYNDWASANQRALLSQEFYGLEFKPFKDESVTTRKRFSST